MLVLTHAHIPDLTSLLTYLHSHPLCHPITTCSWPAFEDCIKDSVLTVPDADGMRTEIICAACHRYDLCDN